MRFGKALFAIGLAVVAAPMLVSATKAQAQSSVYARMAQTYAGGSAGPSSPTAQQRFFPGVVARLSAGGRSAQSTHTVTDVTMKRGIVGTAKHPDFLRLPHASHAPAKKPGGHIAGGHIKVFSGL